MKFRIPWNAQAPLYDRAVTIAAVALPCLVIGALLVIAGNPLGLLFAIPGALMWALPMRCPRCAKSLFQQRLLDRKNPFRLWWNSNLIWPEHKCSDCGADFTHVQE